MIFGNFDVLDLDFLNFIFTEDEDGQFLKVINLDYLNESTAV